ncbi:MAG: CDP-archaeol synthase [Planctomycetes bacterium]|nr:CDP-archaeol synthase [Planctomycetota bacterium]
MAAVVGLSCLDTYAIISGIWLLPLAVVVAILGSGELIWMMRQRGLQPHAWVIYPANVALVLATCIHPIISLLWDRDSPAGMSDLEVYVETILNQLRWSGMALVIVALAMLATLLLEMRRYTGPGGIVERLGVTLLPILYVGVLLVFVIEVRLYRGGGRIGMVALASLIATVKMCDIGAYTFGRLFGKHKMAPVLSPRKTWEGFVGGLLFGCLGAWLSSYLLDWPKDPYTYAGTFVPNPWGWIVYGLLISATGVLGDLAESLLKRDLGCKDSSNWMPGFGGVLDILDSILFAAPVAYLCWTLWLLGECVSNQSP